MKSVVLNGSSVEAVSLHLTTLWIVPVPCLFGSVVRGLFGRLRGADEEGLSSIFGGSSSGVWRFLPSYRLLAFSCCIWSLGVHASSLRSVGSTRSSGCT